jgi:hypothetical protein
MTFTISIAILDSSVKNGLANNPKSVFWIFWSPSQQHSIICEEDDK